MVVFVRFHENRDSVLAVEIAMGISSWFGNSRFFVKLQARMLLKTIKSKYSIECALSIACSFSLFHSFFPVSSWYLLLTTVSHSLLQTHQSNSIISLMGRFRTWTVFKHTQCYTRLESMQYLTWVCCYQCCCWWYYFCSVWSHQCWKCSTFMEKWAVSIAYVLQQQQQKQQQTKPNIEFLNRNVYFSMVQFMMTTTTVALIQATCKHFYSRSYAIEVARQRNQHWLLLLFLYENDLVAPSSSHSQQKHTDTHTHWLIHSLALTPKDTLVEWK